MAIFASTTTSNYSDPLKAMSIKALEKRLADQQAQMAQQPEAATMSTIPGGLGHVLGVVGDKMAQGRTEQAAAGQKEALARMIAQGPQGPNGEYSPQQLATWSVADPEGMKAAMATMAENRRAAASNAVTTRGQDVSAGTAREGHAVTREGQKLTADVAREGQGVTREGQRLQADVSREGHGVTREGQQLTADVAREGQGVTREGQKLQADVTREGQGNQAAMTAAEIESRERLAKAEAEAKAAALAADPKRAEAIKTSEDEYRKGLSHIDNLEEATKLLSHPGGIYTGALQTAAPAVSGVPGVNMFIDKEKAQRTARFNTIVGEDAIRDMAATLKGSSTNYEMNEFKKMKNDPNISDQQRADQLQKVVKAARADLEAQAKATQAVGGDVARVNKAMVGGTAVPADPSAAARKWLQDNPNDPRAAAVRQKLEGK